MDIERIGKYTIVAEIGRGTMGQVYKAHDRVLNRFVAIKTLSAVSGLGDEQHQRFRREAQAAAVLSHMNIVTVHDFGQEQDLLYIAMELLDGKDLREAIDRGLLKTIDDKLSVMEQISSGLAFAHSKGVIHRDLKPANIHIQPSGQVKIVDFGLARIESSEMTQEGIVLGTPNYMSPEQAMGDRVDARSDIFSAGAVFYEILTNHKPFDADSTPSVLFQVVHKEPVSIRQWTPDVPRVLVDVVERALVKDKTLRFQTARQMRAALSVARAALAGGRDPDASLAEESQRAHRAAGNRTETARVPLQRLGLGLRLTSRLHRRHRGPRHEPRPPAPERRERGLSHAVGLGVHPRSTRTLRPGPAGAESDDAARHDRRGRGPSSGARGRGVHGPVAQARGDPRDPGAVPDVVPLLLGIERPHRGAGRDAAAARHARLRGQEI